MTKTKVIIATAVAAIAGAVTVGIVFGSGGTAPKRATSLSVFNTPQRRVDLLPAAFAQSTIAHHFRNARSRRVATTTDARWWAVPGTHQLICLAGLRNDGTTFGPCGAVADIAHQPMVFGYGSGKDMGGPNVNVVGLVTDGITRVRVGGKTVPVRRNSFHLTVPRGRRYTMRATGPNVPEQVHDLALGTPVTK